MNICNEEQKKEIKPLFVAGRIYKWTDVYIATSDGRLVNLNTGNIYDHQSSIGCTDVTDQYCLQKV